MPYAKNHYDDTLQANICQRHHLRHANAITCNIGGSSNTAKHLTPNNGLIERDDRDEHKSPYDTPHEMLHAYGKPKHGAKGKDISAAANSARNPSSAV